jgi:uncharacterized protein YndB with AHSA1/START domain
MANYWGPIGMSTPLEQIAIAPHVGGGFEMVMINDDTGQEYPVRGVIVAFDPPRHFSFTDAETEGGMVTEIAFRDFGDHQTETVTHQRNVPVVLLTPEARAGLETSFVKLAHILQRWCERPTSPGSTTRCRGPGRPFR